MYNVTYDAGEENFRPLTLFLRAMMAAEGERSFSWPGNCFNETLLEKIHETMITHT